MIGEQQGIGGGVPVGIKRPLAGCVAHCCSTNSDSGLTPELIRQDLATFRKRFKGEYVRRRKKTPVRLDPFPVVGTPLENRCDVAARQQPALHFNGIMFVGVTDIPAKPLKEPLDEVLHVSLSAVRPSLK